MSDLREYVKDRLSRYPAIDCALHYDLRRWLRDHPDHPSDNAALRTGNARERIATAMYDGNEAFHAALAHERGREYQRIVRPPWADTDEYYRALYLARADAALAVLGITVTDPDPDAVRVAVHSMLDRLGAMADEPSVAELQAEAQRLCDADRRYEDGESR